jgi:hypothetical protein
MHADDRCVSLFTKRGKKCPGKNSMRKWRQRTMNDVGANATEERMFSACVHHLFGYGT